MSSASVMFSIGVASILSGPMVGRVAAFLAPDLDDVLEWDLGAVFEPALGEVLPELDADLPPDSGDRFGSDSGDSVGACLAISASKASDKPRDNR